MSEINIKIEKIEEYNQFKWSITINDKVVVKGSPYENIIDALEGAKKFLQYSFK